MDDEKRTIGRTDRIDLPELGIYNIKAKIDTGAYTSSIHCNNPVVKGKKKKKLVFHIVDSVHSELESKEFSTEDFSERKIKNSFGQTETRYVVKTPVLIFNKIIETEFTLSDRSNMKHPVLLGRKFLNPDFIVDISRFNLSYRQKRKKERKKNK